MAITQRASNQTTTTTTNWGSGEIAVIGRRKVVVEEEG
jgi:hypothetical protein